MSESSCKVEITISTILLRSDRLQGAISMRFFKVISTSNTWIEKVNLSSFAFTKVICSVRHKAKKWFSAFARWPRCTGALPQSFVEMTQLGLHYSAQFLRHLGQMHSLAYASAMKTNWWTCLFKVSQKNWLRSETRTRDEHKVPFFIPLVLKLPKKWSDLIDWVWHIVDPRLRHTFMGRGQGKWKMTLVLIKFRLWMPRYLRSCVCQTDHRKGSA